jgi:hypothetical protein
MADAPPCIPFPKGKTLSISLPIGVELRSLVDISQGPPTDCALAQSLMLQIMPTLGGMACVLKVLKVIAALKNVFKDSPPYINPGALPDFATAIADMADCLGIVLGPLPICSMVKDILRVIIAYINCMIEAVESILEFQVGIDLNSAEGNPVLLATLECAQENAATAMGGLMEGMQGIMPLMEMINMVLGIVGVDPIVVELSAETPSLASLTEIDEALDSVKQVVQTLESAIEALPC